MMAAASASTTAGNSAASGAGGIGTATSGGAGGGGMTSLAGAGGVAGSASGGASGSGGVAGGSGACTPPAVICDDFEKYAENATDLGPDWIASSYSGAVKVDASKPHAGKQSLHLTTQAGMRHYADIIRETRGHAWPRSLD